MHKIFIEDRCMVIRRPDEALPETDGFINADAGSAASVADSFKESADVRGILITTEDTEEAYRTVCSRFKEVNAAGGLVSDGVGKVLMIRRNGLWDLPKGHQEKGEDIRTTALREVKEETGLTGITASSLICITDHCYVRNGIWHLKHTWWYSMEAGPGGRTVPQTEEGISEASWIDLREIPSCLENSYPSIAEVFCSAFQ